MKTIQAFLRRLLFWPVGIFLTYLIFLLVYGVFHGLTITVVLAAMNRQWDYDRVATMCNNVALWPWRTLGGCRLLVEALEIVGALAILAQIFFFVAVLPVKLLVMMVSGMWRLLAGRR